MRAKIRFGVPTLSPSGWPRRAGAAAALAACALAAALIGRATPAEAATFNVTRTDDPTPGGCAPSDCSLREAILAANGSPGSTIVLPPGTYTLTIPGADNAVTKEQIGDLDIRVATTIVGAGAGSTIVQAGPTAYAGIHRLFDNHSPQAVRIANMTIRNGKDVEASGGGCIRNLGVLTLESVVITGCESPVGAAGVASYHTLTVLSSTITANRAASSTGATVSGGGIGSGPGPVRGLASTVTIVDSIISNNSASSAGNVDATAMGGAFVNTATMVISNTLIDNNTALNGGAGISTGTMTIADSVISNNRARFDVGGVDNDGVMWITGSTFSGNVAGFGCIGAECSRAFAGGVLNTAGGTMYLDSSTFSGNSCLQSGGGILNAAGTLTISSSTFAGNTCGLGAGVDASDTVYMKNTIVADNIPTLPLGGDTGGVITSQGYNLIENMTGVSVIGDLTGNITGKDPKLGPLQDNGGPTPTRALLAGSPAINAGNPNGCRDHVGDLLQLDQRGRPRVQHGRCDIGALEVGASPPRDLNGDGASDILFRHSSGLFYAWFMDGTAIRTAGSAAGVGHEWAFQGMGDFDGDGKADIFLRHESGLFYTWLMDGTTIKGSGSPAGAELAWAFQGIGDFDGDGKADVLFRHTSGQFLVWLMDGTTIRAAGSPAGVGHEWAFQGVGDFDGDGKADIFLRHQSGLFYTWLMDGTTIKGSGSPAGAELAWAFQGVGDFDGDGKADALFRHTSGQFLVWLMDGTTIRAAGSPAGLGLDWMFQALGDYDGSGTTDVLLRHSSGTIHVWLMNGISIVGSGSPAAVAPEWQVQ